jgi:hypothetical protein
MTPKLSKTVCLVLLFFLLANTAYSFIFTRRTDQFKKDLSYAVLPLPYSIPGIGSGVGVAGGVLNVGDSYTDVYGLAILGDVEGRAFGITDVHLMEKRLILDLGYSNISKASFNVNYSRGMAGNEDPEDFNTAEISDSTYYGGMLTLSFAERMFELTYRSYRASARLESIRDKEGNIVLEVDDPEPAEGTVAAGSIVFDFTDDRHDPRAGLRYNYVRDFPEKPEEGSPDYYTADINVTLYIPLLTNSTFVTNYFQSDAYVLEEGETDRDVIAANEKLATCPAGDTTCETARESYIDLIEAANRYGNASSLGGLSRLRSFTSMRYRGAHTRFWGAEFRWNLTDENTKFNILFMKDLRTSIQLAFFHEEGTIADKTEDLYEETRRSTGVGIRAIMGSGLVYRFEVATGEEGSQFVLFLGYPWDLF